MPPTRGPYPQRPHTHWTFYRDASQEVDRRSDYLIVESAKMYSTRRISVRASIWSTEKAAAWLS